MNYTIEQLEHISRTIFAYEQRPTSSYRREDTLPIQAALALVSGIPDGSLGWSTNLRLGLLPDGMPHLWHHVGHPLEYAAAFAAYPDIRDRFLARAKKDVEEDSVVEAEHNRHPDKSPFRDGRPIPPPSDPAFRLTQARAQWFSPYHATWYTPEAITKIASQHLAYHYNVSGFLSEMELSLTHGGLSLDLLTEVATKAVIKALDRRASQSTRYEDIAKMARLGDQAKLEDLFMSHTGIYRLFGITLQKSKPATMIAGLKALAGSARTEMLLHFGRPPTADELIASNVKGAAHLWHSMPWAFLEPIVKEHGSTLRAALLQRPELSTDLLRVVLIDHPDRLVIGKTHHETRYDMDANNWPRVRELPAAYFKGIELREALQRYPKDVANLISLFAITRRKDVEEYIQAVVTVDVRKLIAKFKSPVYNRDGYYTHEKP